MLLYEVSDLTFTYDGYGKIRPLLSSEVLHIRERSDDGLVGRSRFSRAASTFAGALAIDNYQQQLFSQGVYPSGILSFKVGMVTPEQTQNIKQAFEQANAGPKQVGRTILLPFDLPWTQISMLPEDQELLNARRFSTEELPRIFGVSFPLSGNFLYSSFTNAETASRWFSQFTLTPWCRKIEAVFSRQLLSNDREFVIDLSGPLRGTPQERCLLMIRREASDTYG